MRTAILAAVLAVSFPTSSLAAGSSTAPDSSEEARRRFDQGAKLYAEGDLAGARFEFERAHALSGNYKILYNLAVVLLELHDYAEAKRVFERYLAEGEGRIDAARLEEVDAELSELQGRVGRLALQIEPSATDGLVVSIDGDSLDTDALDGGLDLNLGPHALEVSAAGYLPYESKVEIEGGLTTELTVRLDPRRPPAPTSVAPSTRAVEPDPPRPSARTRRLRIGTAVTGGLTAGLGVAALVTGTLALRAEDDLAAQRQRVPGDRDLIDSDRDRLRGLALGTDILIGVGAAAAVTTLGLGLAAWRSSTDGGKTRGARARVQPESGRLEVRF